MDSIPNSIHGKRYHTMDLKDPECAMLIMKMYRTLDNLEGLDTHQRCKGLDG